MSYVHMFFEFVHHEQATTYIFYTLQISNIVNIYTLLLHEDKVNKKNMNISRTPQTTSSPHLGLSS